MLVMLGTEVKNMVFSNAVGIPVIAVLQGVVALIGYLIIGVKEPWFWFVVTCITAMLPVVGAALGLCAACDHLFCKWRYGQRDLYAYIWLWCNRYS